MKLVLHHGASTALFTLFWYCWKIKPCRSSSLFHNWRRWHVFWKHPWLWQNRLLLSSLNKGWWDFIIRSKYCVSSTSESIRCDISCVLHFSTLRGDNFVRFRVNTKYWECVDSINYYLDGIQNSRKSGERLPRRSLWLCCALSLNLNSFLWIYGEAS